MKNDWEVLVLGVDYNDGDIFEQVAKIKALCAASKITKKEEKDRIEELEEDGVDLEISVIKIDNKHGHESGGWGDEDKIILWDSQGTISNEMYTGNIQWCRDVAQLLCDRMNKTNM